MLFRLLLFAIPAVLIFLFIREYLKQKKAAEDNWEQKWEQKKINFRKEQELKEKEREIEKLKNKLDEQNKNNQ